ncbi:MAG: hypothetical protein M1380_03925, partial [Chloroflexi bacterium]|nr:hypothetical protein [Chloroflexota bacterium]
IAPTTTALPARKGFSPLDMELGLTRRPWTEAAEKGMARLGALIPFYRMAAGTYAELVGLSVSASTLEEVTTVAGRRLLELEADGARASVALPSGGGMSHQGMAVGRQGRLGTSASRWTGPRSTPTRAGEK